LVKRIDAAAENRSRFLAQAAAKALDVRTTRRRTVKGKRRVQR
jgi:hypothetical protein